MTAIENPPLTQLSFDIMLCDIFLVGRNGNRAMNPPGFKCSEVAGHLEVTFSAPPRTSWEAVIPSSDLEETMNFCLPSTFYNMQHDGGEKWRVWLHTEEGPLRGYGSHFPIRFGGYIDKELVLVFEVAVYICSFPLCAIIG